jgi:hypothetical protein
MGHGVRAAFPERIWWLQKHPSFVEQLKLQAVRFVEDSVAGGARSS